MALRGSMLLCALALVACASSSSGTGQSSSELDGVGSLSRKLTPTLPVPTSAKIGAKLTDVAASVQATAGAAAAGNDCTTTPYRDGSGAVVYTRLACASSTTLRFLNADGTTKEEHADLNQDGLVDRYTDANAADAVAQYTDANFDGKIDVVTERVDRLTDFSLDGYGVTYPASDFLYRIREDRNRDGQLDVETITAKGTLAPSGT